MCERETATVLRQTRRPAAVFQGCGSVAFMEFIGIPLWLLFGILGAWIATTKGRGGCAWFVISALLGPIGLIIAAVIPRKG